MQGHSINYESDIVSEITTSTRIQMLKAVFTIYIAPVLAEFDNLTGVSDSQVPSYSVEGFENIRLGFDFECSNASNYYLYTTIYDKRTQSGSKEDCICFQEWQFFQEDNEKYEDGQWKYTTTIEGKWACLSKGNNLLTLVSSANPNTSLRYSWSFIKDKLDQSVVVFFGSNSYIHAYYDDDSSHNECDYNSTTLNVQSQDICVVCDVALKLNSGFKGILNDIYAIYNNTFGSPENFGMLIDIEGTKYRRLGQEYFVIDYK